MPLRGGCDFATPHKLGTGAVRDFRTAPERAPSRFHGQPISGCGATAGRDGAKIAAALLLTALDVPRAMAIQDYLLSNRYLAGASRRHRPPSNPIDILSPRR